MIRGRILDEMIRIRPESQSYRPKVGVTVQKSELQPGRPPEFEPNRPEKEPEWGLGLDIFETPVTVTPQQEISKTLNSSKFPKNT